MCNEKDNCGFIDRNHDVRPDSLRIGTGSK